VRPRASDATRGGEAVRSRSNAGTSTRFTRLNVSEIGPPSCSPQPAGRRAAIRL
jgi:hypothetical protein